jgi:uncharacterized lipoprotein YddW (UPF0748 family)
MNLNSVVVQIRPTADALYKSSLNPWSEVLTGTQGKSPGYDPLEFMVQEAHNRNIEFHAWFNPFRVTNDTKPKVFSKDSVVSKYPGYVVNYDGKKYIDPGIPEARKLVVDSVMEVVTNYDIDGIHFDDYFYPYPSGSAAFPDNGSYKKYSRGFEDKNAWRRDNIDLFIKEVYENVKAAKPYVKVGVSPFGIWRSTANDPNGADVNSSVSSYDSLHANTAFWAEKGWIDYIAPQIYWELANKNTPYGKVFDFWVKLNNKYPDVQLYIGHAGYKIGQAGWKNKNELPNQLKRDRSYRETSGSILYNYSSLISNPLGFADILKSEIYKYPALVPQTKNPSQAVPKEPKIISATRSPNNSNLVTFSSNDKGSSYFVVYKNAGTSAPYINDPACIAKIIRNNGDTIQYFSDTSISEGSDYTYIVTAFDRYNTESKISNIATAKAYTAK